MQKSSSSTGSLDPQPGQKESVRFKRQILILAQQLLQALDDREDELERFRSGDLPGFNEWFARNFAAEKSRQAELERELAALVQFHNAVVAVSKMRGIGMPQAYQLMLEEQREYVNAGETRRAKIEEAREQRETFIKEDLEREFQDRVAAPAASREPVAPVTGDPERLKLVYRQLVRRLHPDMQGAHVDVTEARWQKRIWHLSQQARARGDVRELEALFKVSLLRQMELSELTISDAYEVHEWLKREMSALDREYDEAKAQAAWGFTELCDTAGLERRVRVDFEQERVFLQREIDDIRGQHAFLEVMSVTEAATAAPKPRLKRPSRPRRAQPDDGQLSLFADGFGEDM